MRIRETIFLCLMFALSFWSIMALADSPMDRRLETPPTGAPPQIYSRSVEIRAVWMDRKSIPKTEQGIRDLVRTYARSGINVLLPEVIYNGYSAYPSVYLRRQNLWNGLDMLATVIDEAHKNGIEVHPWVWVFRTGNASDHGGILKRHPDWAALDRNGNSLSANHGYWLCPSMPEVRSFLTAAYLELARNYPIDGLHLDYIRFEVESPQPYCYNESCRTQFKAQYGMDPKEIAPYTKPVMDWQMWRENLVNTFVADISRQLREVRPGIQISAAVGSDPEDARITLLQNWGHWADNKWVDVLCPMNYSPDAAYFSKVVGAASSRVSNKALLAPGIGLFGTKEAAPILAEIGITQSTPVEGSALFASEYLDARRLQAIADGPYRNKAQIPMRVPLDAVQTLMSSAKERLGAPASVDQLSQAHTDLATAANLLQYWLYKAKDVGYVVPTPAPIFIPEKVQPFPQATVFRTDTPPVIDGRLDDAVWKQATLLHFEHTNLGYEASQPTDVLLAADKENLYVGFRCYDPNPDKIKATVTEHDAPVFKDDAVEIFLRPGKGDYFHFAMNGLGAKFEQKVYDTNWNGTWQGASAKESGAWTAEIAIPYSSLGAAPSVGDAWTANFCRDRILSEKTELSCWSETYGSYHTPARFGTLQFP